MNKTTKRVPVDSEYKTMKYPDACARYSCGKHTMRLIAKDAGAEIKIGRIVLLNISRIDRYLDSISQ